MKNKVSFQYFNESSIEVPFGSQTLESVIGYIEENESCRFLHVEVVFVDDEAIQKINKRYLNHDYITDIITFPYHEEDDSSRKCLEGTLYCCAPQIQRQFPEYGSDFETEVLRVVIHGLLHLAGYHDDTPASQSLMRHLENRYITLYQGN